MHSKLSLMLSLIYLLQKVSCTTLNITKQKHATPTQRNKGFTTNQLSATSNRTFYDKNGSLSTITNNTMMVKDFKLNAKKTGKLNQVFIIACRFYNISNEQCSCSSIEKYDSEYCHRRKHDHKGMIGEIVLRDANYFKEVCHYLEVPPEHCKCPHIIKYHENITPNTCEEIEKYEKPYVMDDRLIGTYIFVILASLVGLVGNALVIIVRSQNWTSSPHYQLIQGLALSDIMFCIVQLMYVTPSLALHPSNKWIYGQSMCKALPTLIGLSSSIDLGFIVIIAIERYVLLVHPLTGGVSYKRIYALTFVSIVISVADVTPMFLVFDVKDNQCVQIWDSYPNGALIYAWVLLTVFFLLPVGVTTWLYYKSVKALKLTVYQREMLSAMDTKSRVRLMSENRRILVVLSSLLIAFVLLVIPNRLAWILIESIGKDNMSDKTFTALKIFALVPYSLHTTINPIIYSMVDKRFRRNTKNLFKCTCSRLNYNGIITSRARVETNERMISTTV